MTKVSITFNNINDNDVDKVKRMLKEMVIEEGNSGWFYDSCEDEGIESFNSCDYTITVAKD